MILEAFRLAPNCDKNGDGGGGGGSVLVSTGGMSCALGTLDSAVMRRAGSPTLMPVAL